MSTYLPVLIVKTCGYQHIGLLRMQVHNQQEAGSMAVESLLRRGLEPTNIPLLVRGKLGM